MGSVDSSRVSPSFGLVLGGIRNHLGCLVGRHWFAEMVRKNEAQTDSDSAPISVTNESRPLQQWQWPQWSSAAMAMDGKGNGHPRQWQWSSADLRHANESRRPFAKNELHRCSLHRCTVALGADEFDQNSLTKTHLRRRDDEETIMTTRQL